MANIEIFGTLIRNDNNTNRDKIVQGSQVEGGYFVCSTLPTSGTWTTGQLCYCTGDSKFHQYDGTAWAVANLGGSGAVDLTETWTFTLEDGTVITKNVVTVLGAGTATEDWTFTHEDGSTVTKKVVIE
jgi:hypothetical protein